MSLSEPLRASAQHIELLQDKRRRLCDALMSAELPFMAALRRECRDGEVSWAQLREAYNVLSVGRLPGLRARSMMPFRSARRTSSLTPGRKRPCCPQSWSSWPPCAPRTGMARRPGRSCATPTACCRLEGCLACGPVGWMPFRSARRTSSSTPGGSAVGTGGVWRGHRPLHRGEYYPPIGQWVVYVLFDVGRHPVYVRSTNRCSQRFADHRAQGKRWSSWTAYAVDSAEAYEVQARFVRRYQTDLNRQRVPHERVEAPPACSGKASGCIGSTTQAPASVLARKSDSAGDLQVFRPSGGICVFVDQAARIIDCAADLAFVSSRSAVMAGWRGADQERLPAGSPDTRPGRAARREGYGEGR